MDASTFAKLAGDKGQLDRAEVKMCLEADVPESRKSPDTANPAYVVRWGKGMEATEFSKTYFDASDPQQGFAALMVCGEADAACLSVRGAATRISMPYLDPKIYDGSTYGAMKYGERRDDIGRLMLSVMMQVRNRLNQYSP